MRVWTVFAVFAGLALVACSTEPQYPVRPGEPRAEFPRPTYPIREGEKNAEPVDQASAPASPPPAPAPAPASPGGTSFYRPQPIIGAPPPPDERREIAFAPLRGHASPGPSMPVRSSPAPALETPSEVTVRPGESLFEVAERVRAPVRALIDLNGLRPPYEVTPGSTLRVPRPVIYTVVPGDTLFSIGRKYSVDPHSLANFNDISMESGLKPGQQIALPASVTERGAPRLPAVEPAAPAELSTKTRRAAPVPPAHAASATPEPEAPSPAAAVAAGKGKFVWPVTGDILSTFGPKGPGQRNDGINIAANDGDSVKAAAAGQIVYAGSTIPGFGNLVVIKHPDGWTSLYGNLGKIEVKIRAEVTKGQEIGVAGLSGSVDRPQVHFEVRYAATPQEKARPVDPQQVLP